MARTAKFIKWPGSKTAAARIVGPIVAKRLEAKDTLVIPFAGSLALCEWLHAAGHLKGKKVICNDFNPWLINAWRVVNDKALSDLLLKELESMTKNWEEIPWGLGKEKAFDNLREDLRSTEPAQGSPLHAAWFLFFNRTCFNGLWRESKKSGLNVPVGKKANGDFMKLPDWEETIKAGSWVRDVDIEFSHGDFREFLDGIYGDRKDMVVYADPPYHAKFVGYNKLGFNKWDQGAVIEHLERVALEERGCSILSNSAELYGSDVVWNINRWTVSFFDSKTSVSCGKDKGKLKELVAVCG